MNFAKHRDTAVFLEDAVAVREQHELFCSELAEGLHALAQPLSVLRSAVELLVLAERTGFDRQRYLEITAQQTKRTCEMFSSIQDLLVSATKHADRVELDFWSLATPIIEDQKSLSQGLGIGIAAARREGTDPVFGDARRTEQAISAVLESALSISSRGDVLELTGLQAGGFFEFTVQNARNHGKGMNSTQRLNLSLAKANILSQQGRYHFAEDPFCVSFALPVCGSGPQDRAS